MKTDFFDEKIIEFPFKEDEQKWGTRTIGVKVEASGAAAALPEIDPNSFEITPDYLKPIDPHREGEVVVFRAEVDEQRLNLDDLGKPILFRIRAQEKTPPPDRPARWFKGKFRAEIELARKIRWSSYPTDAPGDVTYYSDGRPIELDPDGRGSFVLEVWLEEWNASLKQWERKDEYDFSHWLAPNDPFITLDVVTPVPLPWEAPAGSSQDETTWKSALPLPDASKPGLSEFPLDTVIRVHAWKKGDIVARISKAPYLRWREGAKHAAEGEVPLRLCPKFELWVKFEPEGGRVYEGITFAQKEQFASDSLDQLTFVAYARRKDQVPEKVYEQSELKLSLQPEGEIYELKKDEAFQEPGKVRATVRAKEPLFAAAGAATPGVAVRLEGKIKYPNGDELELPPLGVPLAPLFPELQTALTVKPAAIRANEKDPATATFKISYAVAGTTINKITSVKPHFVVGTWGKLGETSQVAGGAEVKVTAFWAEKDTKGTVEVAAAELGLSGRTGDVLVTLPEPAKAELKITGANPRLTLETVVTGPSSTSTGVDGKPIVTADADGTSLLTITPKLTLFGEPYSKELTRKEATFSKNYFEEQAAAPAGPGAGTSPLPLQLRCLFHLKDDVMKQLASAGGITEVSIKVGLTDKDDAAHYPDGIPPETPAKVKLQPSRIKLLTDRDTLPGRVEDPRPLFVAALRASVKTASGKPVGGTIIRPGATADSQGIVRSAYFQGWTLRFRYNPPLKTRSGQSAVTPIGVDDQGRVIFEDKAGKAVDLFEYDHLECCWNNDNYELEGQNGKLTVEIEAESEVQDSTDIHIGEQVKSVCLSWDYSAFYLSNGQFTHAAGTPFNRQTAVAWLTARLVLTTHTVYECNPNKPKGQPPDEPMLTQLSALRFPQHTILIGGGGHHGIVVWEGSRMTVRHFMMALPSVAGKPQARWFNRDQIRKMEKEQNKPTVDFADAYAYIDTLEEWLKRNSSKQDYSRVEALSPGQTDDTRFMG